MSPGPLRSNPLVIIIGGGFGGLYAAKELAKSPVEITLLDRKNHHVFQPLLYQVATAGLSPANISAPIRSILRKQKNVEVLLAEAKHIDVANKQVITDGLTLPYDYLIIATGARHSYFGKDEWEKYAPGLKSLEDALEIRRRILTAFESAEKAATPEEKTATLTFIIVGGGPTGVELAGAIAEIAKFTLVKDFRHIDPRQAKILLFEAEPNILPMYSEKLIASAVKQLQSLGIEVQCNSRVNVLNEKEVEVNGKRIRAHTILWAAGNVASPLAKSLGVPLDKAGRVIVNEDLTLPGHPEIQVIGDIACFVIARSEATRQSLGSLPGVAQVAIQQGRHAARNIKSVISSKGMVPFHYKDLGSMATIGRNLAIADLGFTQLTGFLAWLSWLFIHIIWLIGFRNRFLVLFEWAYAYVTYTKGARLITDDWAFLEKDREKRQE